MKIVNSKYVRFRKDIMAHLKILSGNLSGETEKNLRNLPTGYSITGRKPEPVISQVQV